MTAGQFDHAVRGKRMRIAKRLGRRVRQEYRQDYLAQRGSSERWSATAVMILDPFCELPHHAWLIEEEEEELTILKLTREYNV